MKSHDNLWVLILVALSTLWLGMTSLLMGHHKHIEIITNFYGVTTLLPGLAFNLIAVAGFVAIATLALLSIKDSKWLPTLGWSLVVVSLVPLLALFSSAMWISSLGGFPAIGSGQGIIKYAALLSIGIWFLRPELSLNQKKWLAVIPVLSVLVWIGGMKFTLLEAKGIEPLVASSPLMGWMYSVWDLQTTSNLIGVYDLIAVILLVGALYDRRFFIPAIGMSGSVFLVTQTFLFTWEGALSSDTGLTTGGHFLIKDLWYVANLILFYFAFQQEKGLSGG